MELLTRSEEGMVRALAAAMQVSQAAAVEKAGGLRARAKAGKESVGARFKGQLQVGRRGCSCLIATLRSTFNAFCILRLKPLCIVLGGIL